MTFKPKESNNYPEQDLRIGKEFLYFISCRSSKIKRNANIFYGYFNVINAQTKKFAMLAYAEINVPVKKLC